MQRQNPCHATDANDTKYANTNNNRNHTPEDEQGTPFWLLNSVFCLPALPSIDGLVATARGEPPDPIPNSAVKTLSADGTAS